MRKRANLITATYLGLGIVILWFPLSWLHSFPASQSLGSNKALVRGFITVTVGGKSALGEKSPPQEDIFLPNVKVTVLNLLTNIISDPVSTDLSGRFTARIAVPGRLRVCWEAKGFQPGCSDGVFSVSGAFTDIGAVRIPVPRLRGGVAVYGRVTLADGSSPRALEPLANINAFATISLLEPNGTAVYDVPVNNDDQYLLPFVPLNHLFQIRIREEDYDHSQGLVLGNDTVPTQNINFTILNRPPRIEPLIALDNNRVRVANATPGTQVTLNTRVSDPDQDQLHFIWNVSGGTLSSATVAEPTWTLPAETGNQAATLVVYDGKGGYAKSSVNVIIDPAGLVFSGTVSGTDTLALSGAEVDVNGGTAVTDSRGYFRLQVPDKNRFVMTIRKIGYSFSSDVYYNAVVGGHWQLTKASVFSADPAKRIDLQDERSGRGCAGAPSARLNWKANPALAVPEYQDGRGNAIPFPKEARYLPGLPPQSNLPAQGASLAKTGQTSAEAAPVAGSCCAPGVRVTIPPNSLVDASGNKPTGKVSVQLSTVDLQSPGQMPGNYTVFMSGKEARQMQSYGAGIVEIFAGTTKYNLRSGAKATLIIPVDAGQLQAGGVLPSTIPLLAYDEVGGGWTQTGTAKLQTTSGVKTYVGTVTHFTAYNTDLIKTDQSCVSVQNQNMPPDYDLEVTIPQSGGAAPVKRLFHGVTGGTSETVLINLPKEKNIVLVPIRTTDPDPNRNQLPIGVFVVNTGEPQNPAWPIVPGGRINEPVGPPYYHLTGSTPDGACSTQVTLSDHGLGFYPDRPLTGAFLHGLNNFAAVNLSDTDAAFAADTNPTLRNAVIQASLDYRHQIDPRGLRSTLSCFKVVNRMPLKAGDPPCSPTDPAFVPQTAVTETATVYANTADLGFGREMHCAQNGANVACYVSNYDALVYTGPGAAPDISKAQSAVNGLAGSISPDATVAMEFSLIEDTAASGSAITFSDPIRAVKYYVFNAAGNPVDKANLDGLGDRPLPQLCMVCHGGRIPNPSGISTAGGVHTPVFGSRADVKLNSKFLPFDLRNFTFAAADTDAANPANKINQQAKFQTLNQMVKVAPPPDSADPSSNAIGDLYDAWYPGGAIPQQEAAVVPLWDTDALHRGVYVNVVGPSCRTCHVTNASPNLRFERPVSAGLGFEGNLGSVQQRVCREHVMPHARRTHDLFWTSINPNQAAQLQGFGDTINSNGWQNVNTLGTDPLLACGQGFTPGGGAPVSPGFFTPIQIIFSGNCGGCHNPANAATGFGQLDLQAPGTYGRIVNHLSFELSSMNRITSNDLAHSYLLHKLNGTHSGLTGCSLIMPCFSGTAVACGGQMPCGGTLGAGDINTIANWISSGALP